MTRYTLSAKQLGDFMSSVATETRSLDFSDNPGVLAEMDMPSWHHLEFLEEMKLSGSQVTFKQLDGLMLALPTSTKRLDLSNNPGCLAGIDDSMPSWHHLEFLEEMKLSGCKVNFKQLNWLMLTLPDMKRLDLSNNPGCLAGIDDSMPSWHHLEFLEEMKLSGCKVNFKQLNWLMLALPTSTKRLDLSNNPGCLAGIDDSMPSWHHLEFLEEMKLSGCKVNFKQLNWLMLTLPTSMKRLDLSNNPGVLVGVDDPQNMPSWHHYELLEEIKLHQCKTTSEELSAFPLFLPASVAAVTLDPLALVDGAAMDAFQDAGFNEDAASPGCWRRLVVQRQEPAAAQERSRCVIC